ncbi:hypothetical protein [Pseudomonas sp. gcc21]
MPAARTPACSICPW